MAKLVAVTTTMLASSGGDRTIKAIIFWALIVLIVAGITFVVRRSRHKRNGQGVPDDWHSGSGQTGQEARSPWQ